ncbi:apolipoprotein A-II [Bombina bombina]|uniref:apolipoprotein A-II n=1 Tax=Bombina bombina TaxID=8345 RepID=UPI00235A7A2A|nr:apolipoprotein A-II [Bombina bombina]
MKVLALVVLIIAVSGLEAGLVKREAANIPNLDQITQIFNAWAETIKSSTQDLIEKIKSGEAQSHAEQYLEQTKAQAEPLKAEMEKWISQIVEKSKQAFSK